MSAIDIFSYNSSAEIIQGLQQARGVRPLSLRQLSKKLGYSSDRTVGMIAQGQRALSRGVIQNIQKVYQLSPREKAYIDLVAQRDSLRLKNRSTAGVDKEIASLKPKRYPEKLLQNDYLRYLQTWYSFPVIEIMKILAIEVTPREIHAKLRGQVSLLELRRHLEIMVQLGILQNSSGDKYSLKDPQLYFKSQPDVPSNVVRNIHKQNLKRAEEALNEQGVLERFFISKTFIGSETDIESIKSKLRDYLSQLVEEHIQEKPDDKARVFQVNLQFFQQSK